MSLSNCPQCWDTPCRCGHQYESWTLVDLDGLIRVLQGVRNKKAAQEPGTMVEAQILEIRSYHTPPEGHRILSETEGPDVLAIVAFRSVPVYYWNEKIGRWEPRRIPEMFLDPCKIRRKFLAVPVSVFPLQPLDK